MKKIIGFLFFMGIVVSLLSLKTSASNNIGCSVYAPFYKFESFSKNPKYACYGKPSEKVRIKYCSYKECNEKYYLQNFCKNGEITTTMYYSFSSCSKSSTGFHDNRGVKPADPCGCEDDYNIGQEPW